MKGLSETSPFHRFANPRRDKSVYCWSLGSYLLYTKQCKVLSSKKYMAKLHTI